MTNSFKFNLHKDELQLFHKQCKIDNPYEVQHVYPIYSHKELENRIKTAVHLQHIFLENIVEKEFSGPETPLRLELFDNAFKHAVYHYGYQDMSLPPQVLSSFNKAANMGNSKEIRREELKNYLSHKNMIRNFMLIYAPY